jgi:hypothetical protein
VRDNDRRRSNGDGGWQLKDAREAKEAKKAKTQKAYRGKQNPGPHTYTPIEGHLAGGKVGTVTTFNDLT